MNRDIRTQINHLMLTMMQDFLEIQMKRIYPNDWIDKVIDAARTRVQNNDRATTYATFFNKAEAYGAASVSKKDMDITLITALLNYDFVEVCKVGARTNFRNYVRNIGSDKNTYISHNSDLSDILNNHIMGLTVLKNLADFLEYLSLNNWSGPERTEYFQEYYEKVNVTLQNFYKELGEQERDVADIHSCLNIYMEKLLAKQEEQKKRYVPLVYRKADSSRQEFSLEELMAADRGLVITADSGYGKSWSLVEMAGQFAKAYCNDPVNNAMPILIEMGLTNTDSAKPLLERINEICFAGRMAEDKLEFFMKETKLLLFVDAMDEAKGVVAENASTELNDFYENYPNIRIIGATRVDNRNRYPGKLMQVDVCNLSKAQLEEFIKKFVKLEYVEMAVSDWITNEKSFYTNLRTPFYITCYCEAINGGKRANNSIEVVEYCLDEMIKREISKGFKASVRLVNEVLCTFCDALKALEDREMREITRILDSEVKDWLENKLRYDTKQNASIPEMLDNLVEMQILKYFEIRKRYYVGFVQEQYRRIYSPDEGFFD